MPEEALESAQVSDKCHPAIFKVHLRRLPRPACVLSAQSLADIREWDKVMATEDAMHGLPSVEQRINLFQDFLDAHDRSLQACWSAAVRCTEGGPAAFDFDNSCFLIELEYRADSDGNPATAYRVKDAVFIHYSDLIANMDEEVGVPKCLELTSRSINERLGDKIWGALKIYFTTVGSDYPLTKCAVDAIYKRDGELERGVCKCVWFPRLKVVTEHGLVYRERVDDSWSDLGWLQKRGRVWQWKPFNPTQLMFLGLPPDLNTPSVSDTHPFRLRHADLLSGEALVVA